MRIYTKTALLFFLCASLLLSGCTGVFYDGNNKLEFDPKTQLTFLMKKQEAPPVEPPDTETLIKVYREYIIKDLDMLEETKKLLLDILDKIESGELPETMLNAVKKAIEDDKLRLKNNAESMKYIQQAVADIIYENHKKLLKYYDNAKELQEKLQNTRKAADITYAEYHNNLKNRVFSNYADEEGYTRGQDFCDAAWWAQNFIDWKDVGLSNWENYDKFRIRFLLETGAGAGTAWSADGDWTKNRMRDWNNQLYNTQIPKRIENIKANAEDYKKTFNDTLDLLQLYLFLYDGCKCANHLDPYHFYESYFSFENSGILQEDFRNKLASYSGSREDDLLRYEDDNIINFVMYAKIDSEYYEKEYFWDDNRPEQDGEIRKNPRNYGLPNDSEVIESYINDRKIRRSGAALLLPVFMLFPEAKGPLSYYDGGEGRRAAIPYGYTWNNIQSFFRGASITKGRYGDTVAGYKIGDYYKKYGKSDKIKYNQKELSFSEFYKTRFEQYKPRSAPMYGLNDLCQKHLISYHTIEPELLEYLGEKGKSITEFQNKYKGEDFNIRNFVKHYDIPEEGFRELFDSEARSFQPYNIGAVYGKDTAAVNYFSLDYKIGYTLSYNMNGVETSGAFTTNVQPGAEYTIAQAPKCPGYIFQYWSTSPGGGGQRYQPYDKAVMEAKNTVYYAQWKKIAYKLTYDLNGGTGETPVEEVHYSEDKFALPKGEGIIPPEGKRFETWSFEPERGFVLKRGELFVMPPADTTLYAVYADEYAEVIYELYGGSASPEPYQTPMRKGEAFTAAVLQNPVPPESFRPGNAVLSEWRAVTEDGEKTYKPGELIEMPGHMLILRAEWKKVYRMTFNANGGRLLKSNLDFEIEPGAAYTMPGRDAVESPRYDPETGEQYWFWWWESRDGKYSFRPGESVEAFEDTEFLAVWDTVSPD